MKHEIKNVRISIPFRMLHDSYLERFIEHGLQPEIVLDVQALQEYTFADFAKISEHLLVHDLQVTLHFPFMDLSAGSPDPAVLDLTRRRFEEMLPLVSLFRPLAVVCHAGYDSRRYGFVRESWFRNSLGTWSWLGERVLEEGGMLLLENVFEDGPEDMQSLLEGLHAFGVGFCLDTGHQAAFAKASLHAWVKTLAPYLKQIHLHDNRGERDDHLALGGGIIDFKGFFRALKEALQAPPLVTLEPHREEDLFPSVRYLEGVWPW